MSLIRIVREDKKDADLFIGRRYIQLKVKELNWIRTSKSQQKKQTTGIVLKFYGKKKLLLPCHGWMARPFQSFPKPLFHSTAKCKASDMKMIFLFLWRWNSLSQKFLLFAAFWKLRFLKLGSGLLSNELIMSCIVGFLSNRTILVIWRISWWIIVHFQHLLRNTTMCYYNSRQLGLLQFTTTCHYNLQ